MDERVGARILVLRVASGLFVFWAVLARCEHVFLLPGLSVPTGSAPLSLSPRWGCSVAPLPETACLHAFARVVHCVLEQRMVPV